MTTTFPITKQTGYAFTRISNSSAEASTFHAYRMRIDQVAVVAETIEDDAAEEREWDSIVSKPHVRQALRRMAVEARRQYYAGETEEGGFAVE